MEPSIGRFFTNRARRCAARGRSHCRPRQVEVLKHADQLARRLADEAQQQQQQVASQLSEVKESATTANSKIAAVSNDVPATKTEVAITKPELDNTGTWCRRPMRD